MIYKKTIHLILLLVVISQGTPSLSGPLLLGQDSEGWTIFIPSSDSRIIYISADGNDTSCVAYNKDDAVIGANPFNPTGAITRCATYTAAYNKAREGYPDWILFNRGDTFNEVIGSYVRAGRSATEPSLIASYGSSGASPIIKTGKSTAIWRFSSSWIALSGLDFYAQYRDPDSPEYVSASADGQGVGRAWQWYVGSGGEAHGILIEGCKFRFYTGADYSGSAGIMDGMVLRRSVIYGNYSAPEGGHSCGVSGSNVELLMEDNIFDHNGWYSQAGSGGIGEATIFNHNIYLGDLYNSILKGNMSLRSSSIGIKVTSPHGTAGTRNLTIENNLLYDDEIGIQLEDNYTADAEYRVKDSSIKNNVLIDLGKSRPTNRTLAWGLQIAGWDGGLIEKNIILHQESGSVTNNFGMMFYDESRNVSVVNNIIHGFRYARGLVLNDAYGSSLSTNMTFSGNKMQVPLNADYTIDAYYNPSGIWSFLNNIYYSDKTASQRFKLIGVDKSIIEWSAVSGDNSTFGQFSFPDASRNIAGYMESIGETGTEDAFIAKCRAQDRYNWNPAYTAPVVNQWIKAGFGLGGTKYKNVKSITQETP